MLRKLYCRLKNLSLWRKVILGNIILLLMIVAVMAMYFFDYYPVVELTNKVFGVGQ